MQNRQILLPEPWRCAFTLLNTLQQICIPAGYLNRNFRIGVFSYFKLFLQRRNSLFQFRNLDIILFFLFGKYFFASAAAAVFVSISSID
jgi:hypothetical protein